MVPEYEDIQFPHDPDDNTKSSLYGTAQSACEQGWEEIKANLTHLPSGTSQALYENSACNVYIDNAYWRGVPVYNDTGGAEAAKYTPNLETVAWKVSRPSGLVYRFHKVDGLWQADLPTTTVTLIELDSGEFSFKDGSGKVERYSGSGQLLSISDINGKSVSLDYDANLLLSSVTDQAGRSLQFERDENGALTGVTDPNGKLIQYSYDANNRLSSVTYQDKTSRQYLYENSNFLTALTGLIDERDNRLATWSYDDDGQAIHSEHAGSVDQVAVEYIDDLTAEVTGPLGDVKTYRFTKVLESLKLASIEGGPCSTCDGQIRKMTYDSNGFVASRTDWNGATTTYVRDALGQELSRTEAVGTPEARTITTEWHTEFRKPVRITEPERTTEFTYDTDGRLLSKNVSVTP
jgi:YD repeat-containing protein